MDSKQRSGATRFLDFGAIWYRNSLRKPFGSGCLTVISSQLRFGSPSWLTRVAKSKTCVLKSWSFSNNASTSPQDRAYSPFTGSPERIIRVAASRPTIRGSLCVPPAPGSSPSLISGKPITASGVATRQSQASAISSAPPIAGPAIAAITGFRQASIIKHTSGRSGVSHKRPVRNSTISAPPEKSDRFDVITIAFTESSSTALCKYSVNALRMVKPSALIGLDIIVITAIPSEVW